MQCRMQSASHPPVLVSRRSGTIIGCVMPWVRTTGLLCAAATRMVVAAETTTLPELMVLGSRTTSGEARPVAVWDRAAIRDASPRTIDELLAREPSFSLYRRQSAWFGNPTSAGVSLRDTGASAASRTVVLLDGIPQNDPFGGWVYWARLDAATIESATVLPPSQSLLWGNQSPAGVIQLVSRDPFETGTTLRMTAGSPDHIGTSMTGRFADAEKSRALSVSLFGFETGGFHAVRRPQRGSIDRPLDTAVQGAELKGSSMLANGMRVDPGLSWYREERGNGTPLARNSTEAVDLSLRLTSDSGAWAWQWLAWHQHRAFESTFASVNADRSEETVALDQYDVPGRGTGTSFGMRNDHVGPWTLTAGADARVLDGATHERVGTFRDREAGGSQSFGGAFFGADRPVVVASRVEAGVRIDFWHWDDARRIETSLADGSLLKNDRQPDRHGIEPSASLGFTQTMASGLEAHASAGTSFRLPTLNELHRPFRVRNDIVEANPELDPERFLSLEAGIDWKSDDALTIGITGYHHRIHDAIANVPVTDAAEIAEIFGSIPAGGSGSQRRNVDLAEVTGIEAKAVWDTGGAIACSLAALWSDTSFRRSADQPLLDGKPFPQAPDLRIAADGIVRLGRGIEWFASSSFTSSQSDDALATRILPDATVVGTGLRWRRGAATWQARVDNLFDEDVVTGIGSDGLRTHAAPRTAWLGVEWEW